MLNLRAMEVPGKGPEDTLIDEHGHVYCSLRDEGCIVRVKLASADNAGDSRAADNSAADNGKSDGALGSDTSAAEIIADTGGAPLGLDWLPDGRLLVCNAQFGLQTVNISTGVVAPLPSDIEFGICNNAHVLPDGTVLVSDSSSRYPLLEYQKDIIENTASGRLIKVSPDGQASILLENLSFANGVVCIDGGSAVLVAETGTRQIKKVSIDGLRAGTFAEVPGHPDNMSIGSDGNVWVAVPSLPSALLALLHKSPLILRKISARLPDALQPKPKLCCRVVVYSQAGELIKTYNGDTSVFNFVTGVRERQGVVTLGSIEHHCIGVFDS